jgi:hypothetical protein
MGGTKSKLKRPETITITLLSLVNSVKYIRNIGNEKYNNELNTLLETVPSRIVHSDSVLSYDVYIYKLTKTFKNVVELKHDFMKNRIHVSGAYSLNELMKVDILNIYAIKPILPILVPKRHDIHITLATDVVDMINLMYKESIKFQKKTIIDVNK